MAACKEKKGKLFEPRFATENVDVLEFLIDAGIKKIVWQYEAGRTRKDSKVAQLTQIKTCRANISLAWFIWSTKVSISNSFAYTMQN